jgi:hypothetical protein
MSSILSDIRIGRNRIQDLYAYAVVMIDRNSQSRSDLRGG